jgi:hypothetical protein
MKYLITFIILMFALKPCLYAQQRHPPRKVKQVKVKFPTPIIFEFDPYPVPSDSVNQNIFQTVIVTGKVFGLKQKPKEVLLFLGADWPNQRLIVILDKAETKILAKGIKGKSVTVTGKIFTEGDRKNGKPVMYVSFPESIRVARE